MAVKLLSGALGLNCAVGFGFTLIPEALQLGPGSVALVSTDPSRCAEFHMSDQSFALLPVNDSKCTFGSTAVFVSSSAREVHTTATLTGRDSFGNTDTTMVYAGRTDSLQFAISTYFLPRGSVEELTVKAFDDVQAIQISLGRKFMARVVGIDLCRDEASCASLSQAFSDQDLPPDDLEAASVLLLKRLATSDISRQGPEMALRLKIEAQNHHFSDTMLLEGGKPGRAALCVQAVPAPDAVGPRLTACRAFAVVDRFRTVPEAPLTIAPGTRAHLCLFRLMAPDNKTPPLQLASGRSAECFASGAPPSGPSTVHDSHLTWLSSNDSIMSMGEAHGNGVIIAKQAGQAHALVLDDRLASTDPGRPAEGYLTACSRAVPGLPMPRGCFDGSNGLDLNVKVEGIAGVSLWLEPQPRVCIHRSLLARLAGSYAVPGEAIASSIAPLSTHGLQPDLDYSAAQGLTYTTPAVQGLKMMAGQAAEVVRCKEHHVGSCTVSVPSLSMVIGISYVLHLHPTGVSGARLVVGDNLRGDVTMSGAARLALTAAPGPAASCVQSGQPAHEGSISSSGYVFSIQPCEIGPATMSVTLASPDGLADSITLSATVTISEAVGIVWPVPTAAVRVAPLNASGAAFGVSLSLTSERAAMVNVPVLLLPWVQEPSASLPECRFQFLARGGSGAYVYRISSVMLPDTTATRQESTCTASATVACEGTSVTVSQDGMLTAVEAGASAVEVLSSNDEGNAYLMAVRVSQPSELFFKDLSYLELTVGDEMYVPVVASDASGAQFDLCHNLARSLSWRVDTDVVSIIDQGWTAEGVQPGVGRVEGASEEEVPGSACGYVRIRGMQTGSSVLQVTLLLPGKGKGAIPARLHASVRVYVYHALTRVFPVLKGAQVGVAAGTRESGQYNVAVGSSLALAVLGGPQRFGGSISRKNPAGGAGVIVAGVSLAACVRGEPCGKRVGVSTVVSSGRPLLLLPRTRGLEVWLEDLQSALRPGYGTKDLAGSADLPAQFATPAYMLRVKCVAASSNEQSVSVHWAGGSSAAPDSAPGFDSFSAGQPSMAFSVSCAPVGALHLDVLRESAYERGLQGSPAPASSGGQFVLQVGGSGVMALSAQDEFGRVLHNASGALLLEHMQVSTVPEEALGGPAYSVLRLALPPYYHGQLSADALAESAAFDTSSATLTGRHMALSAPYVSPSLADFMALYGNAAVRFIHGIPAAPVTLLGATSSITSQGEGTSAAEFWAKAAHSGLMLTGVSTAAVPGADRLHIAAGGEKNISTGAVVVTVSPLSLSSTTVALFAHPQSTGTVACIGGAGAHLFAINGSAVSSGLEAAAGLLLVEGVSIAETGAELSHVPAAAVRSSMRVRAAGVRTGVASFTCADRLVTGGPSSSALLGRIHVAHVHAVAVHAPRLLPIGQSVVVPVLVSALGVQEPFGADQYTHMGMMLTLIDKATGFVLNASVLEAGVLIVHSAVHVVLSFDAGLPVLTLAGREVGTVSVIITVTNCRTVAAYTSVTEGYLSGDCWTVSSLPVSVSVYPKLRVYPSSVVLFPDARVHLAVLGGPTGGFSAEGRLVFTSSDSNVVVVSSDGALASLGVVGNAVITVEIVANEGSDTSLSVFGAVQVPVSVALPSAVYVELNRHERACNSTDVVLVGTDVILSWSTPEGHGPLSGTGLSSGVQVEWSVVDASHGILLPWPSSRNSTKPFSLQHKLNAGGAANDTVSVLSALSAVILRVPDMEEAVHAGVRVCVKLATRLFGDVTATSDVATVAAVPRLRLLYPVPVPQRFGDGLQILMPAGASASALTNMQALWGQSGRRITRIVGIDGAQTVFTCPEGGTTTTALLQVEDRSLDTAHNHDAPSLWDKVPVQVLPLLLRCTRAADVQLVPLGVHALHRVLSRSCAADVAVAFRSSQMLAVVGCDAWGRHFSVGLGSLCNKGSTGNALCSPEVLGIRAFSAQPTIVSTALVLDQSVGTGQDLVLRLHGDSLGDATVQVFTSWAHKGLSIEREDNVATGAQRANTDSYTRGDVVRVAVRGTITPAGTCVLVTGGEVRLQVSDDALFAAAESLRAAGVQGVPNSLVQLQEKVEWKSSNESIALLSPELPSAEKSKKKHVAPAPIPGRTVAISAGHATVTASLVLGHALHKSRVLGTAYVYVVPPSALRVTVQPVTMDALAAGTASSASTTADEKPVSLSEATDNIDLPVIGWAVRTTDRAVYKPAGFMLRVTAEVPGLAGEVTVPIVDTAEVTQRISFDCNTTVTALSASPASVLDMSKVQEAWFNTVALGPGAELTQNVWTPAPEISALEVVSSWDAAQARARAGGVHGIAARERLESAWRLWPTSVQAERLCFILPTRGHFPPVTHSLLPMPRPASLSLHVRVTPLAAARRVKEGQQRGGSGGDIGPTFVHNTHVPASLYALFQPKLSVVPLAVAHGQSTWTAPAPGLGGGLQVGVDGLVQTYHAGNLDGFEPLATSATVAPVVLLHAQGTGKDAGQVSGRRAFVLYPGSGKDAWIALVYANMPCEVEGGDQCTRLGGVDTRLTARVVSVHVHPETGVVSTGGFVSQATLAVLRTLCEHPHVNAVNACPVAVLTVRVGPHVLDAARAHVHAVKGDTNSARSKQRLAHNPAGNLSFTDAFVDIQDAGLLRLRFAFDDGTGSGLSVEPDHDMSGESAVHGPVRVGMPEGREGGAGVGVKSGIPQWASPVATLALAVVVAYLFWTSSGTPPGGLGGQGLGGVGRTTPMPQWTPNRVTAAGALGASMRAPTPSQSNAGAFDAGSQAALGAADALPLRTPAQAMAEARGTPNGRPLGQTELDTPGRWQSGRKF